MKFGGFKIGKSKENSTDAEARKIAEELLKNVEPGDSPVRPHGPLVELSLDAVEKLEGSDLTTDEAPEAIAGEGEGTVKLVEIKPEAAAAPLENKKKADNADFSTSLSSLFQNEEEEENPLANLVKALPDVTAAELMDDLKEIKDIIKDWQKK